MRWSFRVATIWGVKIEIHSLFTLTVLAAVVDGWWRVGGLLGAAWGLLTVNLLFLCVLVHEIAHTRQAQAARIIVRRISLLPLGGVAELAALPDDPRAELKIALAGPLSNLALALIFAGLTMVTLQTPPSNLTLFDLIIIATTPTFTGLLYYLVITNVGLALLNMLPVFPLDGGRVLRSILAMVVPNWLATGATVWLGGLAAVGISWYALVGWTGTFSSASLGLAFLALILLVGGGQASLQSYFRQRMEQKPLHNALFGPVWVASPRDKLRRLSHLSVFERQGVVPVVTGQRLLGMLAREDIARALARPGLDYVAHAMNTQYPTLHHTTSLWAARQCLLNTRHAALPVVDHHGCLLGMVTLEVIERACYTSSQFDPNRATLLIPLK